MELDSFSAVLQLAATLNIAFVAVEYAKGYTNVLSNKLFQLPLKVDTTFKPLIEKLPDKETLETLIPHIVDGRSTSSVIEKIKREREKIVEKIDASKNQLNNEITDLCQSKSFSFLSLYFFFYSLLALFIAGISPDYCKSIWTAFTALSTTLMVLGWIKGEWEKQWNLLDFSSLGHSLSYFLLNFGLSIPCCIFSYPESSIWWPITIAFSACLPFLSFIVFFFKIKRKIRKIKAKIQKEADNFDEEVNQIASETQNIIGSCKIGDYLSTQERVTDQEPDLSWI